VETAAVAAADQMAALLGQATRRPLVPLKDRMAAPEEVQTERAAAAAAPALSDQMLEAELPLLAVPVALALHLHSVVHQ